LKVEFVFIRIFVFQISRGSVAELIRWGGWNSYRHAHALFTLNRTANTALKLLILTKLHADKNMLAPFYGPRYIK